MSEKILVVIPTTARRLDLLKKVIGSVNKNSEGLDVDILIVKNGKFSTEKFVGYEFSSKGKVIKVESYPGGNIPIAFNESLKYLTDDYTWWIYVEDDLVISTKNWVNIAINAYKNIDNCGALGTRLHGGQRKTKHNTPGLSKIDDKTFEVYWSDGIMLINADLIRNHKLRFDEFIKTAATTDIPFQLLELGYENWRIHLDYEHFHIPGATNNSEKWRFAEVPINMDDTNKKLVLKYKNTENAKLKRWLETDGVPAHNSLKSSAEEDNDYRLYNEIITVRSYEEGDIDKGLLNTLNYMKPTNITEDDISSVLEKGHKVFVVEFGKRIVGAITLLILDKITRGGEISRTFSQIEDVIVDPMYRGLGIGSMLLEEAKTYSKENGCYKCILACYDDLVTFYENNQFEKFNQTIMGISYEN